MYTVLNVTREYLLKYPEFLVDLKNFCIKASQEQRLPAHVNMYWDDAPPTLFTQIFERNVYNEGKGILSLAYDDSDNLVGVSGAYKLYDTIALVGARTWTVKEHRTKWVHGNHIFPKQFQWAKDNGYEEAWMTFNNYNDRLFKFLKRINEGKGTGFGIKNSEVYKGMEFAQDMMNINSTDQYVAIKKL